MIEIVRFGKEAGFDDEVDLIFQLNFYSLRFFFIRLERTFPIAHTSGVRISGVLTLKVIIKFTSLLRINETL